MVYCMVFVYTNFQKGKTIKDIHKKEKDIQNARDKVNWNEEISSFS